MAHETLLKSFGALKSLHAGVVLERDGWKLLYDREHVLRLAQTEQSKREALQIFVISGGACLVLGIVGGIVITSLVRK